MKKFMIFLLMAFLYLGTCQARSEASHPDNAKLKLLSWVSPTPSQSFLTRSAAVQDSVPDEMIIHVEGPEVGCAQAAVTFTAVIQTPVNPLADYTYVWKMDGEALQAGTNGVLISNDYTGQTLTFIPENLFPELPDNPVTHEFTVEVSYGECSVSVSPVHPFTINPQTELELVIPAYACDGQLTSTLTAMLTSGVAPEQYKWFIVPKTDATFDTTITYVTYTNELNISNALMANADSIGVMPLFTNPNCPVDTFWNTNVPTYDQMHTLVITGDNAICQNTPATMTATPVEHAYYKWAGPDTAAINAHDSSNNYLTTTVPGVYAVTMYDTLNGCEATAQFTITQFGGSLSITADQTAVCANTPVMLHASVTGFDNQMVAFAWSTNDTASTITVSPADTTTYTVTAYAVGYDAVEGLEAACTMKDSIKIYAAAPVNYKTVIYNNQIRRSDNTLVYSDQGDRLSYPAQYCEGQEIALYYVSDSRSTDNTASMLYNWFVDGNLITENSRDMMIPAGIGIGSHYITAMAVVSGCNTATMSNSLNFIVHAAPEVTISGNNVICNGDTAFITANGTTMLYHPTSDVVYTHKYIWSDSAQTAVDTITTGGTYTVTVTNVVSGKEICSTTATVEVNTFGGDLHVTADQTVICAGTPVVLNANLDGFNNENVVYAWNTTAQDTASMITVFPTDTTTYVVTAIAGNCTKQDSITIYATAIDTIKTFVNYAGSLVEEGGINLCQGQQAVNFVATNSGDATTYTWYVDGQEIAGENLAEIELNFNELGSHYVAAKAIVEGCNVATVSSEKPIYVSAAPEVTIAGNNVICNGDTAVLTAQVINPLTSPHYDQNNYSYTYAWSDNSSTTDTLKATTPGVYVVTVTNNKGCFSTASIEVTTFGGDLHVNASRTVTCAGEAVVLSANLDGFNNELVSYAWNTDAQDTASMITVFPTDTTTYVVTANAGNCSMTDSITIYVNPIPATVVLTPAKDTICLGEQVTFYADGNADSYVWYYNGLEVPGYNLDTLTLNFNEVGIFNLKVKAVSAAGCVSDTASVAAIATVLPAPEFTLTGNDFICNGDDAVITATPVVSDAVYTYTWSDASHGNNNVFTTNVAGTYAVTATDNHGCSSVKMFNIYTTGANLQIIADNTVICDGEYVTLRANFEGFVNELANYTWKANGSVVGNGSNLTVNPSNTTTYVLTVGAGDCTISDSIEIIVHERPEIASITPSAEYICEGGQVSFTVAPASPSYTYEWYLNGIQLTDAGTSTLTLNFDYAGAYQVAARIINEYGCAAVNTDIPMDTDEELYFNLRPPFVHTREVTVPFVVKVLPTPEVQLSGNNIICDGSNAVITANVLPTSDDLGQIVANEVANLMNSFNIPSYLVNRVEQRVSNLINDIVPADFSYQYAWSNGATTQTLTTGTPGIYTVTVTNTAHGLNCYSTASVEIITSGSDLQVYADKMNVCEGEFVVLNANLDGFVNDNVTYTWTNEAGEEIGNVSTITVQTVANDDNQAIYTVTVNAGACEREASITINVTPVDTVYTTLQDMNTICVNNQITAIATTVPEAAATEFIWYLNGLEMPGENQPTITLNMHEEGSYSLAAKAVVEGCTYAPVSEPVYFNVNNNPTVMITGDPIICEGNTVNLYAQLNDTVPGMEGYNYDWRLYNYSMNSQQDTSINWSGFSTNWVIAGMQAWACLYNLPGCPINVDTTADAAQFLEDYFTSTSFDNADHITVTNLPAQDYPYIFTLVVTNAEGCRVASEPYLVYVNSDPHVVATVSDTIICANGEITAQAHLGDGHQPGINFQWQYSYDGEEWVNIPYGLEPTLVTDMFDQDVYLRVVATQDGYGNNSGCTATSDSILIHVITPKQVSSVVVINDGELADRVCEGAQLEITAKILDDEGHEYIDSSYTYMWELNGMQLQTIHGPQFSAQAYIYDNDPVDYIYTAYLVLDVPGCMPIPVSSDTVHVRRNPIVTIDGTPNVCFYGNGVDDNGQPITNVILTAWVDGVEDVDATYTWYESGQLRDQHNGSANIYKENWTPTALNPYIFTVEVTNGDGCSTISDPFTVNVYQKPYVNITNETGTDICEGGDVTLRASLDNYNDPMLTYQWYENIVADGFKVPGATHEFETFTPEVTTDYIVKVTHLMDFTYEHCVAYDTITVVVNQRPEPIAMNDLIDVDTICEGRDIYMSVTAINNGVMQAIDTIGQVYTWYRNGVVIADAHNSAYVDSPVAINGEPTIYVYGVSVNQPASGCASDVAYFDTVVVFPNPALTLVTDPIVCTAADSVENIILVANVDPAPATPLTYRWMEDNAELAVTSNDTFKLFKDYRSYPYNFSVQLVNDYGCASEAFATVYVNDSIVVNITSDTNVCAGGEITLTAALDDWNADQLVFQWKQDGEVIPGATTLECSIIPTEGDHIYTMTVEQLTSGCVATSHEHVVHVHGIPVIDSIYHNYPATFAACDGYQVELTAHIDSVNNGVMGGEIYTWYRNGVVIEGAIAETYSEVLSALNGEPTQYTYAVSVQQEAEGCISEVKDLSAITINPNPTLVLYTDPIVCIADSNNVKLYANVYPENAEFTYRWFENNVEIAADSADSLILTRPFSTDPYHFSVSIVNNFACSATSEALVYVNDQPVVNIFASETQICEGGEVTLTAALNDWNADMLTFQWYDGEDLIPGATTLSFTYNPDNGPHYYTLRVDQLTSGCNAISDTILVNVNDIPVIDTIILSQTNICYGGQLMITAVPNDTVEVESYTWYRNGVLIPGAVEATIYDTPGIVDNNTQQYFYTAVVTRPASGCVSLTKTSDIVTVYPNPVPVITGDQHVCETDSVFLIANVNTTGMPVGALHYTWYESGQERDNMGYGLGDNNFYAEYFYARTEPYRFTVEVTRQNDATGCIATSEEFLVYVYPQPVVNVTATETEICEGGEVTLTANLNDYNAEYITYQWYTVNSHVETIPTGFDAQGNYTYSDITVITHDIIPGATQPTYTTTLNDTTILGVTVLQTNSTCVATDEITINVRPIPVVNYVTVNGQSVDTICDGGEVMVYANVTLQGHSINDATYNWYRNGVLIEGADGPFFFETLNTDPNQTSTYLYKTIVTLPGSGCVSNTVTTPHALVFVNPAPSTVTISGNDVICEGDSTLLTAYSDVEGTFSWRNGEGVFSNAASVMVPAGVYTVTMTTAEGCEKTSEPFDVHAFGTDLIVSASETNICEGEHTTLYVDQNGWQGNVDYMWSNGDSSTTVDVAPATTTTYTVTATVSSTNGSCSKTASITINVNPRPAAPVVIISQDTVCYGNQIMAYVDSASSFDPTYTYYWYVDGTQIEGNHMGYVIFTPEPGIHSFAAKAVSAAGCVSEEFSLTNAIVVMPAPTQVTITGENVICYGTTAELHAQADVPGTFTWSNGMTGENISVPAGVYNVTITTPEGCSLISPDFTVESFGTELTVSASETNICEGEHTTLYVSQNGWQGGDVTYLWSTGDSATTVDVQPATTTTYTVTATITATSGSCTQVGEVTINVNPKPAAPVVMVIDTMLCVGSQVAAVIVPNFDETPTPSAYLNSSYVWYLNGVEIPGENNTNIIVNADVPGSYIFTARAISQNGCISDISNMITDHSHTEVIPAPESVVINGNSSFCNGGSTTLYATVSNNTYLNSPYQITYTWYKDNVAMNIASTDHITVTEAGSYKVVATNMGLCSTESNVIDVTVAEAPQMQLTATETEICVGGTTVITAEATGWNNSDVNYNWNNGYQGSAYTFTATTAGVETFIVTASQSTSGCIATDTITITVNAIPAKPVVNIANQTVCYGGQVTLQVTNAIAGAEYTWYRNGTLIPGAHQATLTESPVSVDGDATVYTYTVVASLPNSGCTSEPSDNAVVNVIPTPVVAVSVEGNTMFCQGGTTMLHANVTPAANYSYQWYKDNQLIEGATSADYVVANEDARETAYNFTVVVTANAGCDVTSQAVAITVVADPVVTATISDAIVCEGGVTTLTATVQGGVPGVNGLNEFTYQWYRNTPNSTDPSAAAQLVATGATYTTDGTETPNNYTYWVVVNNGYNCNALSTPVQFSVVEVPTVNIVRVPEYDATVCDGGETAIKAVIVSGGYGDATYQWYKNGNILAGETNQVLHIATLAYGVNDTYSVEVIQTGVGCFGNASAPINDLVTVNPAYTVDITGFGNVCEGGTLTLTATVNNVIAGDVLNYQWYKIMNGEEFPINGANSATYATSDLLLGNSYEYFVVVSSSFSGCYTVSSTVPANVVSAPSVAIQGANTVCEGGNLTLNAFVTGGVDGMDYTYTWNWTGAANGTATTADPNFVPTLAANDVATPYYFTVTISRPDNTGCTATSAAHEVNVLAVPTVSLTADNAYVCQNGDVTLTAHVSPVGSYNYVWTINGQQQAVNAATVTTSMATSGAINATVVVSAAGASASCSATASLAVPVQVVAAPTVTIAADYTSLCVGGTTTLTANVNANGNIPGDFSYQWAINGIEVDGAVANTFVQPLNAAGVYTYTLRVSQNNNLGCNSAWSAPVTVQVAEQPVVTLSSLDGLNICEGGSVTLNAVVTNYGTTVNGVLNSNVYGAMTFDWTRNGVNVHQDANVNTGIKQFTETLNTIGSYNYQVTVDAAGQNCLPQVSNVENVGVAGNPSWTEVHVYSNNGTDACLGEMVTLMASIQGGVFDPGASTNGHIQWVVTDENGNTINVSGGLGGNSYDIPAAAGTYIYTPTYVDNIGSGCQLTNTADVQVGVTVHELPTAQFTSGDGTSICANDGSASAELVITFTGVAPFVYEVVDGNGNVVEHASTLANTVSIYVSPSEQTTYRINLVQDAYCENTALDANAIATVYVNEIQFATNFFVSGCNDNGQVTISFDVISGNPSAAFTVVYENGLQASGNISNGTATFVAPTTPGDYNAVFTVDGCSYDIVVRVLVGDYGFGGTLPIMDQRWNDVVVVNNNPQTNGGHTFVGYQWYHNGVAIPGATYSNYQDKDGLNGFYSVELIEQDADGNMITYQTCEMYFNTTGSVKVYPVPANVRQEITIELDLTSEQLEGAVLDIFSVTGAHISHVTDLQPITKIEGFKAQGTYFGRILTGTNEIKTVKFVIVK